MEKYKRTWQYECYKLSVRDGSSVSFNSRLCQTKEEESKEWPGKFLGYGFSHYTVANDAFIAHALLIMLWRVALPGRVSGRVACQWINLSFCQNGFSSWIPPVSIRSCSEIVRSTSKHAEQQCNRMDNGTSESVAFDWFDSPNLVWRIVKEKVEANDVDNHGLFSICYMWL